ncbi:hypothetical protein BLGI_5005 [Brevibacillus laterosporus GI-9]|nr:hypothetical protein BLGI_5005 [Brevibacillus laterosporus GI-9]
MYACTIKSQKSKGSRQGKGRRFLPSNFDEAGPITNELLSQDGA